MRLRSRMIFRLALMPSFAALALGLELRAAGPVGAPAPFVAPAADAPGVALRELDAARRALAQGLPTLAAGLLEKLLETDTPPAGATRDALALDLASARLAEGNPAAADRALQRVEGARTAAWHLRAGLVAARQTRWDAARAELAATRLDELAASDRAWYFFLQGLTLDAARDFDRSRAAHEQAANTAVSDAQRAEFALGRARAQLNAGEVTAAQAEELRQAAERYIGTPTGRSNARLHAAALAELGRRDEAVTYLRAQLRALPPAERKERDSFLLLLGLVAGAQVGEGRDALGTLLADGEDDELQRVALQLLAAASPTGPAREEFRERLGELIARTGGHPILADLLLARAQLALADKTPEGRELAAKDALALLEKFPGSKPLKAAALGTLAGVEWEQGRYRPAADWALKAQAELATGAERAALGVLRAEAWFRAGDGGGDANDFKNAAAAYAAVLEEPLPPNVTTGGLVFQQALALMRAGQAQEAAGLLDRLASDARLDPDNRWRAEWNLMRALEQEPDGARTAYARVNKLLAEAPADSAAAPAELRVRMRWLQARLALDAGEPARAKELARKLREALTDAPGAEPGLRAEASAGARLLEARADFRLGETAADRKVEQEHVAAALETLRQLRADFPKSDAAMESYLEEAEHLARPGDGQKIVDAEVLLQTLADEFPERPAHASFALFRKALLEAQRGPDNYENAISFLDKMLELYPASDLVFPARMEQGRLWRELGQFPKADQVYELLVREFAAHPGALEAELALADTHAAQVLAGGGHYESALSYYRRLQGLAGASPDLRMEAGCKLGVLLAEHGDKARAAETWHALADPFLSAGRPGVPAAPELGASGRFWLDQALNKHADQLTAERRHDQARNVLELIVRLRLPSEVQARARLRPAGGATSGT